MPVSFRVLLCWAAFFSFFTLPWANEAAALEPEPERKTIVLRLIDQEGQPVSGAEVGLCPAHSDERGWQFASQAKPDETDERGTARLVVEPRALEYLSLVAWHQERGLAAVVNLAPEAAGKTTTITMQPGCRVSGRMTCEDLAGRGEELYDTVAVIDLGGNLAVTYGSNEPVFEFFLPPGEYQLEARSAGTHTAVRSFTVPPGQTQLQLPPLDLPLTQVRKLEGQPAPELPAVLAWKNSGPLTLADLRGKVVLLDFWGWWCGACTHKMPELFKLHDEYHQDGLVILGVHVDAGEGINTAEALDKQLAPVREQLWGGRDIPYPVAFVEEERTAHLAEGVQATARSRAAAAYGVTSYPTYVLIDREGKVVGKFWKSAENLERLKRVLDAKPPEGRDE